MAAVIEIKYFNTFTLHKTNNGSEEPIWNGSRGIPKDIGGYDVISNTVDANNWVIEESRISGGYNNTSVDFGAKAYIVEEDANASFLGNSLIYSGPFNSRTGINRTNVFSVGEDITKSADPANGSIQKLHASDSNLNVFQELKVSRALIDKDAVYSAEGGGSITSSNLVIGVLQPYGGEYGISKNPESFSSYGFRAYWADKNRGVVLRLSRNGIDEISAQGMSDYFSDKMKTANEIIGSYDDYSNCYNISFSDETVSYKQGLEGWPTRKSFVPEMGVSLNNTYYTFKGAKIWSHDNEIRNNFYGTQYKSSVKLIFNGEPSKVKNFKTLSYEGSSGWSTPTIQTDLQNGKVPSYIAKEGIYYNFIKGKANSWNNIKQTGGLDSAEFSTQGIDVLQSTSGDNTQTEFTLTISENND